MGKKYIGNTSRNVKLRTQEHVQLVRQTINTGKKLTSFASHFASLVPSQEVHEKEEKKIRDCVKIKAEIV